MRKIMLHTTEERSALSELYRRAVREAVELYIVSAYLTEWAPGARLKKGCKRFRLIVGSDFGITRKQACSNVLRWLPANRKADFLVADQLTGFHPKAMFWRNGNGGENFMVVGSSNLSTAAFEGNVEANVLSKISNKEFYAARRWVEWIEKHSVPVSEQWLDQYVEAPRRPTKSGGKRKPPKHQLPIVELELPKPRGTARHIRERKIQLSAYMRGRSRLLKLFRNCETGLISSRAFFDQLPNYWGVDVGNRLQGNGWERRGKKANFKELAKAFVAILDAEKGTRDDVVRAQLDHLRNSRNPARRAFFSEMLCLRFPNEYPVLNDPVREFLIENRFSAPKGASEGARYIDLARKLRAALTASPNYPAKNLAELDALIWARAQQRKAI
jgi:hypothetical protein